ncbi:MAG: hypothetical protein CM1200mP27_03520 [Chloroflexota bacterium]|nr:MAG: hypothetical protein CM1200mP27_03520 [Chloroflexota bacterium]
MAGPLMPLRVNSRFSSKRTPLQDARQGMDNPESSRQNSKSGPLKGKGDRAGLPRGDLQAEFLGDFVGETGRPHLGNRLTPGGHDQ